MSITTRPHGPRTRRSRILFADPVSTTSVQLTGTLDPDAYAGELTRVAALDP
jgi:hypothetical protein